jgi:hypothetical protein
MTDSDLVAKKLAFIETCLRELETIARPELVESDVRERRFVEHTLQITIQAALDVASHIVSDARLGEPRTHRDLFDLLVGGMVARRSCFVALIAVACGDAAPSDPSSTGSETVASESSTTRDVSSSSEDGGASTSTSGSSGDPSSTDAPSSTSGDSSTGAPVPDFDELPWQTGDEIGYGIAYKDSQDPSAHSIFVGYAGYPFPLDAAQSWVTELYHARLAELGVRHVYAVQGPATVGYVDLEIGNSQIAEALGTQLGDTGFVLVAGHSSGTYVAHELLGQLRDGLDGTGVTEDRVVYFNLDGGVAGLEDALVARLHRAYFVSVLDSNTGTVAPNRDAMQYAAGQWPDKGGYLDLEGNASGCNAGAQWCLHMVVINQLPHDPTDSSVVDYYDFVDRPVVTEYIDRVAADAGLTP